MRSLFLKSSLILAVALSLSVAPAAERASTDVAAPVPTFKSIGPLTFGPDGLLFAGDTQSASIFALELGALAQGGAPGAKAIAGVDQQIAALLGTDVREITVTDLAVHPKTRNAYLSVMRGQGANASPVAAARRRRRQDRGAGVRQGEVLESRSAERARRQSDADPARPAAPQSITDMAFVDGRLYVAGLSNEEFSSKLRSVPYPFSTVDNGTSVEIYHGNHGAFETRSPVYTFVPYKIERRDQSDCRLPVHAAREVPGQQPEARREGAGDDDRRARQPQPAARHGRSTRRTARSSC